jgi:glycosyltransferase involved in cell wall biosynthesis
MARYLCLTQLYPSGLSGTSVKTKHTLEVLLQRGHQVDVVCVHHQSLLRPTMTWPAGIRIFVIEKSVFSLLNWRYILQHIGLFFSLTPFRIKKMFDVRFASLVQVLLSSEHYDAIFFDGFAMLQYLPVAEASSKSLNSAGKLPLLYIDDEDITDLMRRRWQEEINPILKIFFWSEWLKCQWYEKRYLSRIDQLWAISEQTLARLKPRTQAPAFVMPTIVPIHPGIFNPKGTKLVFTGLLSWLENINGLRWFLQEVWPEVRRHHPKTELVVMGQMAKPAFIAELKSHPGVIYKGFVKDLRTIYKQAAAAVAPILINCGIKIKVVTYLSYGLPVVTTPQSAGGLGSLGGVLTGATSKQFAAAVIKLLKNQKLRSQTSRQALQTIKLHHTAPVLIKFFKQVKLAGFNKP